MTPALTPGGLPYPLPTDPVTDGADDIRRLAEALDPVFVCMVGGDTGQVGANVVSRFVFNGVRASRGFGNWGGGPWDSISVPKSGAYLATCVGVGINTAGGNFFNLGMELNGIGLYQVTGGVLPHAANYSEAAFAVGFEAVEGDILTLLGTLSAGGSATGGLLTLERVGPVVPSTRPGVDTRPPTGEALPA